MDQEHLQEVLVNYFVKHPELAESDGLKLVKAAYQQAQEQQVPEYQPLDVKPLARDTSSYHDQVVQKESKGIEDEDLNAPLAGGGYARG